MKFIFLGIVQGLTEFLPVSSSGHLYIFKNILNLTQDLLPFFVFLHLATLLAILIFLHKEIIAALGKKNVLIQIGVITCITVVFGFTIDYFLKDIFENRYLVIFLLFLNGVILLSIRKDKGSRDSIDISLKDSFILGALQGLAVLPGISRSGITIAGALKRGFKAKEAFALSFLMAIPAIIGAFVLKFNQLVDSDMSASAMAGGFAAALLFGLLALYIVRKALLNRKFSNFGYYCIIASIVILFI